LTRINGSDQQHGTWEAGCLLLHHIQCISMLAAPPGDIGPLSSLHVSDRRCLAVKTTAGDGMLMLQAADVSVLYMNMY